MLPLSAAGIPRLQAWEDVNISPVDITTSSGLTTLTNGLTAGALVKVYGVPQSNGTLQAYVLACYTGTTMPSD